MSFYSFQLRGMWKQSITTGGSREETDHICQKLLTCKTSSSVGVFGAAADESPQREPITALLHRTSVAATISTQFPIDEHDISGGMHPLPLNILLSALATKARAKWTSPRMLDPEWKKEKWPYICRI